MKVNKLLSTLLATSIVFQVNAWNVSTFQKLSSLLMTALATSILVNKKTSIKTKATTGTLLTASLYAIHVYSNMLRHPKRGIWRWLQLPTFLKPSLEVKDKEFELERVNKKIAKNRARYETITGLIEDNKQKFNSSKDNIEKQKKYSEKVKNFTKRKYDLEQENVELKIKLGRLENEHNSLLKLKK